MLTVYVVFYAVFSLLLTLFFLPKYYLLGLFKGEKAQVLYASKVSNWWGRVLFKSTGSTIEIVGKENIPKDETVLIVSNHQSNFDIPVLLAHVGIPFGFIAKKELGEIPVFRLWMKYFKCVFIDRKDARKSLEAIQTAVQNIKNGYSQLIFPEGTRSKTNKMAPFKNGSLKIATKTNATILPITISDTYKMMEETGKITKAHVKLVMHKPIKVNELDEETKKNLAAHVQEIIESGLNK